MVKSKPYFLRRLWRSARANGSILVSLRSAARTCVGSSRAADLSDTKIDPFARALRHNLRKKYGFDFTKPIGVTAIYSEEPPLDPIELAYDHGEFRCVCPGGENGLNDCAHRNRVEGSSAFVPSVFGMTAASVAVRFLAS